MPELWAGTDAGKGEHHCTVIDAGGTKALSRRVPNSEDELLQLLGDVLDLADGDPVTWAVDLPSCFRCLRRIRRLGCRGPRAEGRGGVQAQLPARHACAWLVCVGADLCVGLGPGLGSGSRPEGASRRSCSCRRGRVVCIRRGRVRRGGGGTGRCIRRPGQRRRRCGRRSVPGRRDRSGPAWRRVWV